MRECPMWIGGREARSEAPITVAVPYDGEPFATVFAASTAHLEQAVAAARAAARAMRGLSLDERSAILRRASAALLADKEEFARTISSESGKPIREARVEVERAASTLLFSSEEAHRLAGEVVPMEASAAGRGRMAMTLREPLGVIAAITPFNFPLNLSVHKIGPALAAGNAVVHKPASATPVCAIMLARLLSGCGLPDGALNVVTGSGAAIGDFLVEHPAVRMITFTGSAEVGLHIRARAGLKRVTLELGNNSALIVEDDADLDDCIERAVPGAFAHSGQVCISVQRIFVHQRVFGEFVVRFTAAARALKIGHPLAEDTAVSSLITEAEACRVQQWLSEAQAAGASLQCGGARSRSTVAPAVLTGVPEDSRVFQQEAFGPLAGINSYSTLDEAIASVNHSDYGLQAGIFTRDLSKAFHAAREVEVGGFLINDVPQFRVDQMPYGGVKLSGAGREGPRYAIEEMTEPKLISWRA
ncbi:MAG: aldehyde dehydrogenase family protein [Candidatus Solibacter usitatus]|nr:aldehyde dehydrogenase family protein [Candidatus Solibacter usitatus]